VLDLPAPHPGALGTALPYLLDQDVIVPNVTRFGEKNQTTGR